VDSSEMFKEESLSAWCETYLDYLSDDAGTFEKGDLLLPGTGSFLKSLSEGSSPDGAAATVSDHLLSPHSDDSPVFALILALEALASGHAKASSVISTVLDSMYRSFHDDHFLSWELCISGILATKEKHADDFFHSAQVLARQLDRLLLVWLILRCRIRLNIKRDPREQAEISLLLVELDQYIGEQLSMSAKAEFMLRSEAGRRLEELRIASGCPEGSLRDMRDSLEEMMKVEPVDVLREICEVSPRLSPRSEISTSLEIMGILMKADRVLALSVMDNSINMIEVYGLARSRLPGDEVRDCIQKHFGERMILDNFGRNPFGSRRYVIIPAGKSGTPAGMEKRLNLLNSERGNCILLEIDSPFRTLGKSAEFFTECLIRQVGASLLLRDRESMAYIDSLSGSDIGYSWMKRLVELTGNKVLSGNPVSVLLVDVDGLREINRLFGHRRGDDTLKKVVSLLKGTLRPDDIVGRISEDLFGILLPDTGEANAIKVAQRLCSEVAGSEIRPDRVPVTISVGTAVSPAGKENPELIVKRAFSAMSYGKLQGGNQSVLWSAEEDILQTDPEMMMIFNTGDPGWDHSIAVGVMELLTKSDPSLMTIAERFRDILRSEYIRLEDGQGNRIDIGSRVFRGISKQLPADPDDGVRSHFKIQDRYDALSVRLGCGGRLISVWDGVEGISDSLRNIFRALASFSSMLILKSSITSGHRSE